MTGEQQERRVEEPVVEQHRARPAEARVALTEEEEQPGGEEEQCERCAQERVHLLPDVEPARLETLELARGAEQAAPVAEERDERKRRDPPDTAPEVNVLHDRPAADEDRETRQVEDEPGREQQEEAGRVHPVQRALRAREAPDPAHEW